MRRAHEEVLDVVAVLHVHPGHAAPAALLRAVGRQRQRLDVAGLRDRDDHLLLGDQVLDADLVLGVGDDRPPLVAEAVGDLPQLLDDDREDARLVAEDRAQLADALDLVGVLGLDRVGLERGELRQAQVEDRRRLDLGQPEAARRAAPRAASRSREARISSMIASRLSSAMSRPSSTWTRRSSTRSSCCVRRTTTSRWCWT